MNKMSLPDHWKMLPFMDCLKKVKTKKKPSIPKRGYQESGEFPVIDQGALFVAGWTDSAESVISDNLPVVIFGDHTRIFKYVDFSFALGADGTQLLYANDEILDPHFFYYALLNLKVPNKGYNRHYRYLREFSVVCPPLPEQHAIAYILQTIQEAKSTRQREITLERERKAALMDYLFSHGTRSESRKQTEIGEIPESWEVVRLEDTCHIIMGQSPPSTTYNNEGIGMPFLQGKAEFTELFPVPTKYCTMRLRISPQGSVLMSVRAPVGDVNLADTEYVIGRGLTSISLKYGNNLFLFYLLLHHKNRIQAQGYGSIFKSINKATINDFIVPLPQLSEQDAIAKIFQTVDKKIQTLKQEAEYLDELFHAMLEELMTGRRSAVPLAN